MKHALIVAFILSPFFGLGQSWEVGGMLGASNYHGDLAYNIVLKETKPSGGLFVKYNFNEYWSIRPTISRLYISGSDENFPEYNLRNLSFRNTITEFSTNFEFNFKPFSNNSIHQRATFYTFLAPGLMINKPEAELNGVWHSLHPLQTEGNEEHTRYRLTQIVIPFGGGVKYAFTDNIILGFEVGWRKTFTDYLDDVSGVYADPSNLQGQLSRDLSDRSWEVTADGSAVAQPGDIRGDDKLNDWYFQTAFKISYRFTPIQCPF